jgi:hypothetical protein
MQCSRCLFEEPVVTLNSEGVCNLCEMYDKMDADSKTFDFPGLLKKIQGQKRKYHCLMGVSGGLDSSLLLEYAVKKWGLNPLVIHFDNGWNVPEANANIETMVRALNVDFIRYHVNQGEYDEICRDFLLASVSDADITNDIVMAEMMLRTAKTYKIKYILNGHNFRTEGSSPLTWSYMDAKYIQSVYKRFSGKELKSVPLLTFWDQIGYSLLRIKRVDPFHYMDVDMDTEKQRLIKEYGWQDYGAKHSENLYTNFVSSYYLPEKFDIDKRITYISAVIRNGRDSKDKYQADPIPTADSESGVFMLPPPVFKERDVKRILKRLKINKRLFDTIMAEKKQTFRDFETYHSTFRRYRWLLWLLMKMGLVQYTFYKKYTR